jgi:hypothetical protein
MDNISIGEPHGTTLAKALEALHRRVEKPIVLIIDEAQHARGSLPTPKALAAVSVTSPDQFPP